MANKNWISISKEEYTSPSTQQIICDSSDSEDEFRRFWLEKNSHLAENSTNLSADYSPIIRRFNNCCCKIQNSLTESPVATLNNSPEILQKTAFLYRVPSPELRLRRLRIEQHQPKKSFGSYEKSPIIFSTQNIESGSPTSGLVNSPEVCKIEPFQSQLASTVEEDASESRFCLYYQPPKRRKTYKKGGIAHQLQNVLRQKRARIKIWHHEKLKNIDNPLDSYEDIICFKFKNSFSEYGVTVLECDLPLGKESGFNRILLDLGVNQILHIEFQQDRSYKLYPPYNIDSVCYNGDTVPYYYNISKVIEA